MGRNSEAVSKVREVAIRHSIARMRHQKLVWRLEPEPRNPAPDFRFGAMKSGSVSKEGPLTGPRAVGRPCEILEKSTAPLRVSDERRLRRSRKVQIITTECGGSYLIEFSTVCTLLYAITRLSRALGKIALQACCRQQHPPPTRVEFQIVGSGSIIRSSGLNRSDKSLPAI